MGVRGEEVGGERERGMELGTGGRAEGWRGVVVVEDGREVGGMEERKEEVRFGLRYYQQGW